MSTLFFQVMPIGGGCRPSGSTTAFSFAFSFLVSPIRKLAEVPEMARLKERPVSFDCNPHLWHSTQPLSHSIQILHICSHQGSWSLYSWPVCRQGLLAPLPFSRLDILPSLGEGRACHPGTFGTLSLARSENGGQTGETCCCCGGLLLWLL